jgi:hypothetical protein
VNVGLGLALLHVHRAAGLELGVRRLRGTRAAAACTATTRAAAAHCDAAADG